MPTNYQSDLRRRLSSFVPAGSPLTVDDILYGAQGTGLDPRVLAVIARKESEFGRTSGRFVNNAFGYNVHGSPSAKGPTFGSWREGARATASDLARNYKAKGLTTLDKIINTYAPPSENNTAQYRQQVKEWAAALGMDPNSNVFGGAEVSPSNGGTAEGFGEVKSPGSGGGLDPAISAFIQRRAGRPGASPYRAAAMEKLLGDDVATEAEGLVGKPAFRQEDGVAPDGIQAIASSQLGVPYSWGGGTPSGPGRGFGRGANTTGFDCSSFVQYVWAKKGVNLPRTTYDQIKVGQKVSNLAQARPGDLLFPHSGHVMMYLGNGRAIHAPRTGEKIQYADASARSYIAIRRPA
jgi:cell wall-associated NlpC family hydrolase